MWELILLIIIVGPICYLRLVDTPPNITLRSELESLVSSFSNSFLKYFKAITGNKEVVTLHPFYLNGYPNDEFMMSLSMLESMLTTYSFYTLSYLDAVIICRIQKYHISETFGFAHVEIDFISVDDYGQYKIKRLTLELYPGRFCDLPIKPILNESKLEPYKTRGSRFLKLTQSPSYLHATGYFYISDRKGKIHKLNIDDRVIVDPTGTRVHVHQFTAYQDREISDINTLVQFCPPTIPVYSFKHRMWGEVEITAIKEVSFDPTAYDRIFLKGDGIGMIQNLITKFPSTPTIDFMNHKRKGLIFLFSGNPGTGKSLTATALSELVQKPFYRVSIADLGNNAHQIDQQLEKIFANAETWQAIVLIDEIDIFTKRKDEIMLSAFLRLIENFNGILFLTTNYPHEIDPAIINRIHLQVSFPDLEKEDRIKMWRNSLHRYQINETNLDLNLLSEYKLSNRQIDNFVQLGYISVAGNNSLVTTDVFSKFLTI